MGGTFRIVDEHPGGRAWLHVSGSKWIVKYDAIKGVRAAVFCAYKSIEKLPAGRMPWTVDNRRIGGEYRTITEAKDAIRRSREESLT